jgi:hypothetical protein
VLYGNSGCPEWWVRGLLLRFFGCRRVDGKFHLAAAPGGRPPSADRRSIVAVAAYRRRIAEPQDDLDDAEARLATASGPQERGPNGGARGAAGRRSWWRSARRATRLANAPGWPDLRRSEPLCGLSIPSSAGTWTARSARARIACTCRIWPSELSGATDPRGLAAGGGRAAVRAGGDAEPRRLRAPSHRTRDARRTSRRGGRRPGQGPADHRRGGVSAGAAS